MNKLEERHKKIDDSEYYGHLPGTNALKSHSAITKEVAIGFHEWVKDNIGWMSPIKQNLYRNDELFEMYLNTLK